MGDSQLHGMDQWLDLVADEVTRRIEARDKTRQVVPAAPPVEQSVPAVKQPLTTATEPEPEPPPVPEPEPVPSFNAPTPSHAAPLMARLALGVLAAIVLINIPLTAQGTALARSIPSSASLIIANGLLIKEEASQDVYVYRDGKFHWITSLDAFEHFGYRWQDVHNVEKGFLNQFENGSPLYVLLKCDGIPHIYRLEAGQKRWIVDIPTFLAEGHVWQDVKFVSCGYLHNLPDGDSIPPGRGTPQPPLP